MARKKPTKPKYQPKAKTFESCLAALPPEQRKALEKLRKAIHATAPRLEECISYGVPSFRLNGRFLMAIGATSNHCSFYPGSAVQGLKIDLKGYETAKGTVRFAANKALPEVLVRKLVRARMANAGLTRSV